MSVSPRQQTGLLAWRRSFWILIVALACLRFAHVHLLWPDEDYHLSAALDILHGKIPYRDFWYDKPPLDAIYYLLIGAHWGWALRALDAGYVTLTAWLAFRLARDLWGTVEGYVAGVLLTFFLTFYLPAAVIPFAADALLIVPHLAAISCAVRRRFFLAGIWAGIGFLFNAKALFVLLACVAWGVGQAGWLFLGFAIPLVLEAAALVGLSAWTPYVVEVWRWGVAYARSAPAADVFGNAVHRVLDWAGFHSAVVVGFFFGLGRNWRLMAWIVVSFAAVCVGGRFMPRYFLQLLPPLVIVGSHGIVTAYRKYGYKAAAVCGLLLLIPVVRFGPRYVELALHTETHWSDVRLDQDSQRVARELKRVKQSDDTLFVWGYRPDMYVYARMVPPGLFWDSQPLTGVPADRHLTSSVPIYAAEAARNRESLVATHPTFIVDGLGLLNPRLAPGMYPELRMWLGHYRVIYRTPLSVVYQRTE